jgi:26S proteasome regulatory subunit T5
LDARIKENKEKLSLST